MCVLLLNNSQLNVYKYIYEFKQKHNYSFQDLHFAIPHSSPLTFPLFLTKFLLHPSILYLQLVSIYKFEVQVTILFLLIH